MEYIQGDKFRNLTDNRKIFYCDTNSVNDFLNNLPTKNDFILISHNSDYSITYDMNHSANSKLIPPNLVMWFGQNVNVENNRIQSIPIGLENNFLYEHIHYNKIDGINRILNTEKRIRNLLYVNHKHHNGAERKKIYEMFNDIDYATCYDPYVVMDMDTYFNEVYNHKFMISPEGNGIDCHRTWECLYLNTIPIEKSNINNKFYTDLPICFVDEWEEINEDFLNSEYDRITNAKWNMDKLDFQYWKKTITEYELHKTE